MNGRPAPAAAAAAAAAAEAHAALSELGRLPDHHLDHLLAVWNVRSHVPDEGAPLCHGGRAREGQIGTGNEGARRAERHREREEVRAFGRPVVARARKRQLMITTMPGAPVKASESVTIIATM